MKTPGIERIFDSGFRAAIVAAGGGSGALHQLLSTPGASSFVSEVRVPYSPEAMKRFLGEEPGQVVSPDIALKLARAAFDLQVEGLKFLSVSCTAALQTRRKRRGDDRAFICIKTAEAEKLYALYFSEASRQEQEELLSNWLLVLIAQAVGAERALLLPGSFNPLHQGHQNLITVAEEMTGLHGIYELSAANVDKPEIPEDEILRRVSVVRDVPVALTKAPRFTQKAKLFPGAIFVLGYDTAVRLVNYARPDEWDIYRSLETEFIVAGRLDCGRFYTLENLQLPNECRELFEYIPESVFREDISSTELRDL